MISEKSFKIFALVIEIGRRSKCMPYTFNSQTYKIEVVPRLWFWRIQAVLSLVFQWSLVASMAAPYLDLFHAVALSDEYEDLANLSPDIADLNFLSLVVFASSFSLVIQVYNLVYTEEFAAVMSVTNLQARRAALYFKLSMAKKDGMEWFGEAMLIGFTFLWFCCYAGDTLMILGGARLFSLLRTDWLVLNLLLGVAWGYQALVYFTTGAFFILYCINHAHGTAMFLRRIQFDPSRSPAKRERTQLMYRTIEVHHKHVAEFAKNLTLLTLSSSCFMQIVGFYAITRISATTPPSTVALLVVLSISVMIVTKTILDFAMLCTNASTEYRTSFYEWAQQLSYSCSEGSDKDLALYREEHPTFRAYRPFRFKIGNFFYIRRTTFFVATSEIVAQNVVNLVLTFNNGLI